MIRSYTQYSVFKDCGAKYKYQYIERRPKGPQGPSAARGTDIHSAVENIITGKSESMPEEHAHLSDYVPFFKKLSEKGARAEMPFILNDRWESVESVEDPAAYIRGFIDIIVPPSKPDNTLYIYELKSGKEWPDHVDQRHFYATVALSIMPAARYAKVIGTYLDQGKNVTNLYDGKMLSAYKYVWSERFRVMDNHLSMVPSPSFKCSWCPYSADKGGPCKFSGNK